MSKKRVQIFNQKTWDNEVNSENKEILNDYILEMKSKRKAEKTIEQYVFDIKMFLCWSVDNIGNKSVLSMKKRDFRRFFLGMQERGLSASRINRVQCSLRNMLNFCCEDDDLYEDYEVNAMQHIKGVPKESVREIHFLESDTIEKMLDILIEREEYQKALYLCLSFESAGRRNEVHQVMKDDFFENVRTNEVTGKRGKKFTLLYFGKTKEIARLYFEQRGQDDIPNLFVVGKGDKVRRLPLQPEQVAIINHYFSMRGLVHLGIADAETPLLSSLGRGRKNALKEGQAKTTSLSRSGLYRTLEDFLAEVASHVESRRPLDAAKFRASSTHWLRHTFATTALREMPVNVVQNAMGHASVGTTSRYLTPEESEVARAMRKLKAF